MHRGTDEERFLIDAVPDTGKQYDRDRVADCSTKACGNTLDEIVAILHVGECDTEHGTVGRDQWQVNAECIVNGRRGLFQEHLHNLHKAGDDQNEYDRLKVLQMQRNEQKIIQQASNTGGEGNDENNSYPELRDVLICFETPRKEQMPKNWLSTTLLTSAVVIMIKSKEVFIRFFPPYVHCGSRPCCSDCSSRHSRSRDLSNGWRYQMRSTLR